MTLDLSAAAAEEALGPLPPTAEPRGTATYDEEVLAFVEAFSAIATHVEQLEAESSRDDAGDEDESDAPGSSGVERRKSSISREQLQEVLHRVLPVAAPASAQEGDWKRSSLFALDAQADDFEAEADLADGDSPHRCSLVSAYDAIPGPYPPRTTLAGAFPTAGHRLRDDSETPRPSAAALPGASRVALLLQVALEVLEEAAAGEGEPGTLERELAAATEALWAVDAHLEQLEGKPQAPPPASRRASAAAGLTPRSSVISRSLVQRPWRGRRRRRRRRSSPPGRPGRRGAPRRGPAAPRPRAPRGRRRRGDPEGVGGGRWEDAEPLRDAASVQAGCSVCAKTICVGARSGYAASVQAGASCLAGFPRNSEADASTSLDCIGSGGRL